MPQLPTLSGAQTVLNFQRLAGAWRVVKAAIS